MDGGVHMDAGPKLLAASHWLAQVCWQWPPLRLKWSSEEGGFHQEEASGTETGLNGSLLLCCCFFQFSCCLSLLKGHSELLITEYADRVDGGLIDRFLPREPGFHLTSAFLPSLHCALSPASGQPVKLWGCLSPLRLRGLVKLCTYSPRTSRHG